MAKISVVITAYNIAPYLDECIQSVRNQTLNDLEIIIVDDGSTDGSAEICDRAAEEDARIRVIHKENGGAMSARKAGALQATSKYLIFADGDDWIDEDFYENLYNKMKDDPVDVVIGGHRNDGWGEGNGEEIIQGSSVHPDGVYRGKQLDDEFYRDLIYSGPEFFQWGISPSLNDKMFSREYFLPYILRVDDKIVDGDDSCCVYPFLLAVNSLTICKYCGYHHRYRWNSLCHTNDINYFARLKLLQDNLLLGIEKKRFEKIVIPQVKRFVFEMALKNMSVIYKLPIKTKQEQYLFPYELVPKGSRIILYGAGKVGTDFYRQISHNNFVNIVLWVDKKFMQLRKEKIYNLEKIVCSDFDYIIISVLAENVAQLIRRDLSNHFGVDEKKIIWRNYRYSEGYGVHFI